MHLLRETILLGIASLLMPVNSPRANAQTSVGEAAQPGVRLEHTTHPLATTANALGRVEGGRKLERMLLLLKPSAEQEESLKQLLEDQQNPKSARYHQWLTAGEFGAQFGATDGDVQKVRQWLEAAGFTVGPVAAGRRWVEFSGTAGRVEAALQTELRYFEVRGKTYLANATDLTVPAGVAAITQGVVSLNNFGRRPPIHEALSMAGRVGPGPKLIFTASPTAWEATPRLCLAPGDFATIYNTKGLLDSGIDGTGVSIVVTGQSRIALTDVQDFRRIFQLPASDPNILVSGPDPRVADPLDAAEALRNVEWAGAVAPGATIDLVIAESTDTTSGVDLAAAYAIDNEVAPILAYTYGSCEEMLGTTGNTFYKALWQQAAAEGITVLVAAGDNGAAGCDNADAGLPAAWGPAVNGIASTPYNVAVGGTKFAEHGNLTTAWNGTNGVACSSAVGSVAEAAWNESCDPGQASSATNCAFGYANFRMLAGAGGKSTIYAKPGWQAGAGVPADGARDLPDVALIAASAPNETACSTSMAEEMRAQHRLDLTFGTSGATAAMAGILALVEQKNGPFQGQVNHALYGLARMPGNSCSSSAESHRSAANSCVFYDITSGNNEVPCQGGSLGCSSSESGANGMLQGEMAGPGYDLVTGLGSVNAGNLVSEWKNWPGDRSEAAQATSASFSISVNPISFAAGSPGSTTVTITPSAGFTGAVALACATGGTMVPAGYTCSFGSSSVTVSGAVATTTLNLTLSTSTATGVKAADEYGMWWGAALSAALLFLALSGLSGGGERSGRNFVLACGLVLGACCATGACGGGAGGGGGPVSTTTTISSSNLHVGVGTPVTFTVTVKPSGSATPTGPVQLIDNGQALGGPTNVTAGVASFLAAALPVGVHTITAQYSGDANTLGSTSVPITQLIAGTVVLEITGTSGGTTETADVSLTLQ